jgi:hypothetical protein
MLRTGHRGCRSHRRRRQSSWAPWVIVGAASDRGRHRSSLASPVIVGVASHRWRRQSSWASLVIVGAASHRGRVGPLAPLVLVGATGHRQCHRSGPGVAGALTIVGATTHGCRTLRQESPSVDLTYTGRVAAAFFTISVTCMRRSPLRIRRGERTRSEPRPMICSANLMVCTKSCSASKCNSGMNHR